MSRANGAPDVVGSLEGDAWQVRGDRDAPTLCGRRRRISRSSNDRGRATRNRQIADQARQCASGPGPTAIVRKRQVIDIHHTDTVKPVASPLPHGADPSSAFRRGVPQGHGWEPSRRDASLGSGGATVVQQRCARVFVGEGLRGPCRVGPHPVDRRKVGYFGTGLEGPRQMPFGF